MATTLTGECFCGEVAYRIEGGVHDARSCHCSRCRKVFSGQASAYALVDGAQFQWTRGEEQLSSYINQQGVGYRFCSRCGSNLCGVVDGQVHGVTLGCLNEDPGIQIERHIFVGSKASWEVIPDSVPQFEAGPPAE